MSDPIDVVERAGIGLVVAVLAGAGAWALIGLVAFLIDW